MTQHTRSTLRPRRWPLVLVSLLVVAGLLVFIANRLIPSDEALALKASAELEKALGVKVSVGALHWRLLPSPAVELENVVTSQPQPITLNRLTIYPDGAALLQRRIKVNRADLDGATVPQLSLRGLGQGGARDEAPDAEPAPVLLGRFVFNNVTWVSRTGIPVVYSGDADFDPNWRPRLAHLLRPGYAPLTELTLKRHELEDRWETLVNVGGGTLNGETWLETKPGGRLHLEGKLQLANVEVQSALAAFNRKSVVSGRASGEMVLTANGDTASELTRSLHTKTPFTMASANILKFDLDKAISTGGKEHAGQTPLDSLTGQFDTQNGPDGMTVDYTNLKASSGKLTASGNAHVANRQVNAEFAVDLVDGLVGVPLKINGPLNDVKVSVPGGAVAGAVVGTAILPGIGTVIGARLGATVGKIFSPAPAKTTPAAAPAAVKKAPLTTR